MANTPDSTKYGFSIFFFILWLALIAAVVLLGMVVYPTVSFSYKLKPSSYQAAGILAIVVIGLYIVIGGLSTLHRPIIHTAVFALHFLACLLGLVGAILALIDYKKTVQEVRTKGTTSYNYMVAAFWLLLVSLILFTLVFGYYVWIHLISGKAAIDTSMTGLDTTITANVDL